MNLFFHGAKNGHKTDAIKKCSKASFGVIDQDHIVPEEYTTYFRSVIAFGKIHIMEDETEMKNAVERLVVKYYLAYIMVFAFDSGLLVNLFP